MRFAQGRFAGTGKDHYFVFRIDEDLGVVSGEIHPSRLVPPEHDQTADLPLLPLGQLSTKVNPSRPDSERDATFTVSPDGSTLTLKSESRTLTFTKAHETNLALEYKFSLFGLETTDEAILECTSENVFRSVDLQIDG